jgi:hypothetical protein
LPAPAVFNLTANGNGQVSIWGFGGNGVTGNQSASNTYITGFQIANFVPEPASIGLIGFIFAGVAARRRRA